MYFNVRRHPLTCEAINLLIRIGLPKFLQKVGSNAGSKTLLPIRLVVLPLTI